MLIAVHTVIESWKDDEKAISHAFNHWCNTVLVAYEIERAQGLKRGKTRMLGMESDLEVIMLVLANGPPEIHQKTRT